MASDYAFAGRLAPSAEDPDVIFQIVADPPVHDVWETNVPLYLSPYQNLDGQSRLSVYAMPAYYVMRYAGVADFYLFERHIFCHLLHPGHEGMAALHILPAVLSLWLEITSQVIALHASTVVAGGKAISFLAHTGRGKSTLAATFIQAGDHLLTDDITLIEDKQGIFTARPGYPSMRLWPDEAQYFRGAYEDLDIIQDGYEKRRMPVGDQTFGEFWDFITPLACIYLLQRRRSSGQPQDIRIEPLAPRQAVIELIRYSFASRINDALGRNALRLTFFSHLVQEIPLRRLSYPSGHDCLPEVRSAILQDRKQWMAG